MRKSKFTDEQMAFALKQAAAEAGYKQVALTVHPQNGARFMYAQCGFEFVELRNTYHLMVARLR